MGLFVCENCGGIENTATSRYWFRKSEKLNQGESRALCWNCDPHMKGVRGGHVPFHGQIVKNPEVARKFYIFPVDPAECKHFQLPRPNQGHPGATTLCMGCGSLAEIVTPRGATGERGLYNRNEDFEWRVTPLELPDQQ